MLFLHHAIQLGLVCCWFLQENNWPTQMSSDISIPTCTTSGESGIFQMGEAKIYYLERFCQKFFYHVMPDFHCQIRIQIWIRTRTQIPVLCRYYGKGIQIWVSGNMFCIIRCSKGFEIRVWVRVRIRVQIWNWVRIWIWVRVWIWVQIWIRVQIWIWIRVREWKWDITNNGIGDVLCSSQSP